MTVGDRIRQARKARDMERGELAKASGVPYPTLSGLENGDQDKSTQIHALADALGVHVRWLATGKGPRDVHEPATGEWADVEGFSQGASLGTGTLPDEWAETHKLKFRASSLHKRGLRPDKLCVYYGAGDSMEPRIKDGDAVMFDTTDKRLVDEGMYVVRWDGHIFAKTLQLIGDRWHMVSENRSTAQWRKPVPILDGDDFEVLGRVCWIGRWER